MSENPKPPIPFHRRFLCLVMFWVIAATCISLSAETDRLFAFFFSPVLAFGAVGLPFSHVETPTLGMVVLGGIWFALLAAALLSRWRPVFFAALLLHVISLAICVIRIPHIPLTTRF